MNKKMKPCPFCGGKVKVYVNYLGQFHIGCTKCECVFWGKSDDHKNKDELIESWNKRNSNS